MESYDEFDDASSLKQKYRTLLTEEEYEMQGSLETHEALGNLMDYIDKNPKKYHSILQNKRKQEYENSSGFSFLKAKLFSVIGIEEFLPCHVTQQDCDHQIKELKLSMSRAFNYAQDAKGRRYSQRLAYKNAGNRENPSPKQKLTSHTAPAPPPPPPPPPLPQTTQPSSSPPRLGYKTQQKGKDADNSPANSTCSDSKFSTPESSPLKDLNGFRGKGQTTDNSLASKSQPDSAKKNRPSTPFFSISEEILSRRHLNPLRSTNLPKSPGGTPIKSASKSKTHSSDPIAKAFSEALEAKFRNVHSRSPCPEPVNNWED